MSNVVLMLASQSHPHNTVVSANMGIIIRNIEQWDCHFIHVIKKNGPSKIHFVARTTSVALDEQLEDIIISSRRWR